MINGECPYKVNGPLLTCKYITDTLPVTYDPKQIPDSSWDEVQKPIKGSWEDMGR